MSEEEIWQKIQEVPVEDMPVVAELFEFIGTLMETSGAPEDEDDEKVAHAKEMFYSLGEWMRAAEDLHQIEHDLDEDCSCPSCAGVDSIRKMYK